MDKKKSFAAMLGRFTAYTVLVGVSTSIMAVVITLVYMFVRWMLTFGGII